MITNGTMIAVADGRNSVKIEKLTGNGFPVYCYNGNHIDISWASNVRKIGKQDIFKVVLDDKSYIKATGNTRFMLRDGSYCELKDLHPGDSLMPLYKHANSGYIRVSMNNGSTEREHRLFLACKLGRSLLPHPEEVCHHMNGDKHDNRWENLEVMSRSEHNSLHKTGKDHHMFGKHHSVETRTKMSESNCGQKRSKEVRRKMSEAQCGEKNPLFGKHHSVETRTKISKSTSEAMIRQCKERIIKQARWMVENGYPIKNWNLYRRKYESETGLKRCAKFKSVLKYFTIRELLKELEDFNHKVKKIVCYGVGNVYDMTVDQYYNYVVLTSKLSGIVVI